MATGRTYDDGCAVARGLDVVGERWALLVVRELLLGPKRYADLQRGLPRASPTVLSARLRELGQAGVIQQAKLPPPSGARVYELTEWGRELEQIVVAIGRWAAMAPARARLAPIRSADSVVLALRDRYDVSAVPDLRARYELRLGDDRFRVEVDGAEIDISRGSATEPTATITTDSGTLADVLWGDLSLADAQSSRRITVDGDDGAVDHFLRIFPMPQPGLPSRLAQR